MEKKTITITEEEFDKRGMEILDKATTDKEGKVHPMAFMLGAMILAKLSNEFFGEKDTEVKPQEEKVEGEA